MLNRKKYIAIIISLIASLGLSAPLLGQAADAEVPQMSPQQQQLLAEMQQLEQEFREIGGKLRQIEQEALAQEPVADARETFHEMVAEKILKTQPQLEDALAERTQYAAYLDDARAGKELPDNLDVNEVYAEYNKLHQQIAPVEQEVMRTAEVQQAFQSFQQLLMDAMLSVDANAQSYLERQNELRRAYQSLAQQMQG